MRGRNLTGRRIRLSQAFRYDESSASLTPELVRFLEEGEPPILFTLGSSAIWDAGNFYRESIAAAEQLGKRTILLTGNNPLNKPAESFPKNVFALAYAPYAQIFSRASVIVHHGGIGTTGQALRAGKPTLVMPFGGDQFDNGARIERLGVGRTIMRKQYTGKRAALELKRLSDDSSYERRAAELAQCIQAEDGVRFACDAIEGLLSRAA